MLLRKITNISKSNVTIILATGNTIELPPTGSLENVDVINLDGIKIFLQIIYSLNG